MLSNTTGPGNGSYRVAEGVQITVRSTASFTLCLGRKHCDSGPRTLEILNAFVRPISVRLAIKNLSAGTSGAQDWMQLTGNIVNLIRAGMLVDAEGGKQSPSFSDSTRSFDSAPIHIAMLNDEHRTQSFLDAIAARVKPGDIVVDLGTGSGVLAVAAAKAGAARVYAVEETRIADLARQVFQANGVADRIQLLEGHSTQISLPERADVLVSEIIGNDPFGERVLESMSDAVARWLKPDACLIPQHLSVYAAPVQMSETAMDKWIVREQLVSRWHARYGIDFSPMAEAAKHSPFTAMVCGKDLSDWNILAPSIRAFDCELGLKLHSTQAVDLEFAVDCDGRCDGIAFWFKLDLGVGIDLTTDPRQYRADNHWFNPLWCFGESIELLRGQRLGVTLPDRSNARTMRIRRLEEP